MYMYVKSYVYTVIAQALQIGQRSNENVYFTIPEHVAMVY